MNAGWINDEWMPLMKWMNVKLDEIMNAGWNEWMNAWWNNA